VVRANALFFVLFSLFCYQNVASIIDDNSMEMRRTAALSVRINEHWIGAASKNDFF